MPNAQDQQSAPVQYAPPLKHCQLESALEDIEKIIHPKTNAFNAGQHGLQAYQAQAIQSCLWMVVHNKKNHIKASEWATESQGFAEQWGGCMVCQWVRKWVDACELPWAMNSEKLVEFSKEKKVPAAVEQYLKHLTEIEMPQGLKKYMELELFPCIQLKPSKGISVATACCFLKCKGFQFQKYKKSLYYDGAGCGLHQSGVICLTVGWLQEASQTLEYGKNYDGFWTGELFLKQILLQEKIIPAFERAHGLGYQMLLMVDNSQGHSAYAKDALLASHMNVNPGGKQAHMWDGWFICNGAKIIQPMIFPWNHPEFPDMLKGMKQYLCSHCDYTFTSLQKNMPQALASVDVHTIQKWEHQMKQWMEAYRTGLGAWDAQFQVQAFSSR
ncbi:hypothetical protein BKA82DRAFT_13154 [Pisolithus tinctorius]|uniref:DDE-1 domain-containing protein n=1 Tax=Pisolithus tinctorius Marx 270 TaxID=870435 RepID=A0A0C3PEK4_PISTI|nr:hypothetical protein BKA82DRAFT_13154 [Pisolithus tinctorius]KIO12255.1 hypothetical protein M404DRAFT_13154 [Pisolithus tinctorius Marx 270]